MSWDDMYDKDTYKSGELALTNDEVNKLLSATDTIQYKALLSLAISNGFRRSDIIQLIRDNYDPVNRTIIFYETKKKRWRKVYIPSSYTVYYLNKHIISSRQSKWLFPSDRHLDIKWDPHISSRSVYDVYNRYLQKAGIENPDNRKYRPFNTLRATCYKQCQRMGWNPRQACELIGDKVIVAEHHYNKPSREEMMYISNNIDIVTGELSASEIIKRCKVF